MMKKDLDRQQQQGRGRINYCQTGQLDLQWQRRARTSSKLQDADATVASPIIASLHLGAGKPLLLVIGRVCQGCNNSYEWGQEN